MEARILHLLEDIKASNPRLVEIYELNELVGKLISENNAQQKKMLKMYERQEEIIKTLMRLKKNF